MIDRNEIIEIFAYLTEKELEYLNIGSLELSREISEVKDYLFEYIGDKL